MAFIGGILILLIVWFLFKLVLGIVFYEDEWHEKFKEESNKLESEREKTKKKKNGLIAYKEFVQNLDEKFILPKDIIYDIENLKDKKVSKQRLDSFIKWLKTKDYKLLNTIKDDKSLNIEIPELIFDFVLTTREDGAVKSPEFDDNFAAYNIQGWETYEVSEISAQNLVKLLYNKNIGENIAYDIFEDGTWGSYEANIISDYYTSEDDLKIPEDVVAPGYNEYFEGNISGGSFSGPVADGEQILYCTVEVNYQDKEFNINGENFKFKESEKDYLATILTASYKPSLLKRVLKELENNENI